MAFGLLYDYLMGQCIDAYKYFGAHFEKRGDEYGVTFRLYAPCASDVSVIGEWNNWDVTKHKMNKIVLSRTKYSWLVIDRGHFFLEVHR